MVLHAGGFVVDFSTTELINGTYKAKLEQMLSQQYVDEATRAVFVTFYTYNRATATASSMQMLVEFSPNGR